MATIDPKVYYDTGKYLTDLGTRLGKANTDLITGLSDCAGMAGNYDDAKKWAQTYDQSADEVIDNTRVLAETLGHFGSLLEWAGYNHDLANHNSNISTSKGLPPPAPVPAPAADACYLDSPTAFGGSGNGLQTDIPNLLEAIGIPVPDGDTGLLDTAAQAWHTFITCDAVEDAMNLSLLGIFRFQHIDSPEIPDVQDHLSTLASCAINIQDSANRLRQACSDHSDGLTQLRKTLHDLLRDLDIQLGLTIAITIFTSFLSAGTSAAAGGTAAAAEITATAARMATAIRDLKILERIAQAFKDVKDLSLAKTKNLINAIRDLKKTSAVEEDIAPAETAMSGARIGPSPRDMAARWNEWADKAYDSIRDDPLDANSIADHTGMSPQDIAQIKNHVFFDEHTMVDPVTGATRTARFDSNPDMADAWLRLSNGGGTATDRLLLDHELAELRYMQTNPNATYNEAHAAANQVANWDAAMQAGGK